MLRKHHRRGIGTISNFTETFGRAFVKMLVGINEELNRAVSST